MYCKLETLVSSRVIFLSRFLATSFYGKKLLNWTRQQSAQWNTEQLIEVLGSFRDRRLNDLKWNVFLVFSKKIGTDNMELLPSQYFISRNLTFRCATKFKSKIIVCMAGWRFSCNFSISYVIVLFCNKVETKGEETIFNLKLLLGCPATKGWKIFWHCILTFLSTFVHTENKFEFIINF